MVWWNMKLTYWCEDHWHWISICRDFKNKGMKCSVMFLTVLLSAFSLYCHNDNLRCHEWRQSWHHGNSRFSVSYVNQRNKTSWINIGSGLGLLPSGTKPLLKPTLIYHQRRLVVFTWGQFHYQSIHRIRCKITHLKSPPYISGGQRVKSFYRIWCSSLASTNW